MQVIIIAHLFTLDLFCPSPLILSWWTKSAITDGTSRFSGWMLALFSTKNNNKQSLCTSNFCHSVVVLGNLLCGILFMVQIFFGLKIFRPGYDLFSLVTYYAKVSTIEINQCKQVWQFSSQRKFRLQNVDHINKTNKYLVKQENS